VIHKIRQRATLLVSPVQWPPCQCRQRAAHVARAASVVAPVPFINCMSFSKSAILHRFLNFYTLRVDIFWIFFHSCLRMTLMNHEKFHGNRSARFTEIRNTDTGTRTDGRGNFIYIDASKTSATALTSLCQGHVTGS